jgi:hypothetical protein
MLEMWETGGTDLAIAKINAIQGDTKTRLKALFSMSLNSDAQLFLAIHS